jgi:hypothetical protein
MITQLKARRNIGGRMRPGVSAVSVSWSLHTTTAPSAIELLDALAHKVAPPPSSVDRCHGALLCVSIRMTGRDALSPQSKGHHHTDASGSTSASSMSNNRAVHFYRESEREQ